MLYMKLFSLADLVEVLRRILFYIFISVIMAVAIVLIFTLCDIAKQKPLGYNEWMDALSFGGSIFLIFFSIWSFFSVFVYDIIIVYNFYKRKIISRKIRLLIQFSIGLITTIVMLGMDKNWIRATWGGYFKYTLFLACCSFMFFSLHYLLIDKRFETKQKRQNIV